jgi:cation transport regulator ChaB
MGATVQGKVVEPMSEEGDGPWTVSLASCPKCHGALLGVQEVDFFDGWEAPIRVWPAPTHTPHYKIPKEIRESLEESNRCLKGKAFTAAVMMSGRALEAVGRHFYPPTPQQKRPLMLREALDKLSKGGIIDSRLHEWGLALHSDRNLAAHPSGIHFKRQDAEDVLKFANNICEYIFVLAADFKEFEERRKDRSKTKETSETKEDA